MSIVRILIMSDIPINTPVTGQRNAQHNPPHVNSPNAQNTPRTGNAKSRRAPQQRVQSEQGYSQQPTESLGDVLATPSRRENSRPSSNGQSQHYAPGRSPHPTKSRDNYKLDYASDQGPPGAIAYDGAVTSKPYANHGGSSTPNKNINATPIKQAYAGGTFQASPAPSSLPVPRFFSKSLPLHAVPSGLRDMAGEVSDTGDGSSSKHVPGKNVEDPILREESPLDFFFNAHRAEQNQANVKSPLNPAASLRYLSTPVIQRHVPEHNTSRDVSQERTQQNRTPSGKDMFMMEMDEAHSGYQDEETPSIAPFRQKMNATLSPDQRTRSVQVTSEEQDRQAKTEALKRLLMVQPSATRTMQPLENEVPSALRHGFPSASRSDVQRNIGPPVIPGTTTPPLQATHGNSQAVQTNQHFTAGNLPPFEQVTSQSRGATAKALFQPTSDMSFFSSGSMRPPQAQARPVAQQAPPAKAQTHPENLRLMEDSLRRVLKLDR